ncbi:MAG: hypothetical protein DRJ96_03615 [Thermoprotei archaeon]|nr:MAG: hypothetical protein DRJ96_03615 [Thermoprotei archaeon]
MESGSELVAYWLLTVSVALAFSLGYYAYISIKRKFDEEYSGASLLPKRLIHGVVYMIFLVLLHEAVKLRLGSSPLEVLMLLAVAAIGIPLLVDIVVTSYRLLRGHK